MSTENRADTSKTRALARGRRGEVLACWALRLKGYRIVARRFRTKTGEIDIIARKGNLVAMVEVKARATVLAAIDAVGNRTQKRIANAGDIWLSRQSDHGLLSIRYDIVAVVPGRWPKHFPGAW